MLVLLVLIVAVLLGYFSLRARLTRRARTAYDAALAALVLDPGSSQLRVKALEVGRLYYAATRGLFVTRSSAVTVYDEAAIANDINARLGAGARTHP